MVKQLQNFLVEVEVILLTSKKIRAESFEDALQQSRTLVIADFISIKGDHNDSSVVVTGLSHSDLKMYN